MQENQDVRLIALANVALTTIVDSMLGFDQYYPISLNENEQVVLSVAGKIFPGLADAIFIVVFAPALFFLPLLVLHRAFRPITYVVTTERIIAVEPRGVIDSIYLSKVTKIKGTKTSLMVYGTENRLWLSRLPDAWFFETVVWKVIEKMGLSKD